MSRGGCPVRVKRCGAIQPTGRPLSVVAPIADKISAPGRAQASWPSSVTEERDHARYRQFRATGTQADTLEQRETDRRKAPATTETCLGDPDQTPDRATNSRSGAVQSSNRQQTPRL